MSSHKTNQGRKTKAQFTSVVERLDGTKTVRTYPTYDALIDATFASATAANRALQRAVAPAEAELGEALQNYTNPLHPDYDPEFHAQCVAMDPKGIRSIPSV